MYWLLWLLWSVWLLWPEPEDVLNTTDDPTAELVSVCCCSKIYKTGLTDDSIDARMQKMILLKNYGMLKEELNWPDITSIADDLYSDGHLNWCEWQKIIDRSQPRRKAIDILLKVVLGNASSVSAFMKIVESKNTLSYIAERINMTRISAEEMKNLDNPPAQQHMKINHDQKESASDALEKFASDLMIDTVRQKLENKARKHLDLEFKEAFWGPLGLMFSFQSGKPSQKL